MRKISTTVHFKRKHAGTTRTDYSKRNINENMQGITIAAETLTPYE